MIKNVKNFSLLRKGESVTLNEQREFSDTGVGGKSQTAFTLAESGRRPLLNSGARHAAFTLAEVLITLAVIGIVAVLTIPGVVKNHQEKSWATAQDLFTKKFEVAMKTMATNSTVSGYDCTESFVNELKKYIKINKVCTDDVTKCFASKVVWNAGEEPVEVTNNAVKYDDTKGDWAETVGLQFSNGVSALISYNKQCDANPFNNQEAVTAKCVGIIYDVSGNKTPNNNGKDILANANVSALGGNTGCVYTLSDGTCITKILAPGTEYSHLTTAECQKAQENGEIDTQYCYPNNDDYYAGAVKACGGKKNNLPSKTQLYTLAQEIYIGSNFITETAYNGPITLDSEKAAPFLAHAPGNTSFSVWSNQELEDRTSVAYIRTFRSSSTNYYDDLRYNNNNLAVCVAISE